MQVIISPSPQRRGPITHHRTVAVANVRWFRAMAWRALRDGQPHGELRAANAPAAVGIVLRQAKRHAVINRLVTDARAIGG